MFFNLQVLKCADIGKVRVNAFIKIVDSLINLSFLKEALIEVLLCVKLLLNDRATFQISFGSTFQQVIQSQLDLRPCLNFHQSLGHWV